MTRFVIFDMDGVLVDSEPFHEEVLHHVFDDLALPFSKEYHHTLTGMANGPMWTKIISDFELKEAPGALQEIHMKRLYKDLEQVQIPPTPGIYELLDNLKAMNCAVSLASSSPVKLIRIFMEQLNIVDRFDFMISGEQVTRSKPFPDIFLEVARQYGEKPELFTVIEDSKNGVKAAKAAGMFCIGYRNPNSGNQDLSAADVIVDRFDTLINLRD